MFFVDNRYKMFLFSGVLLLVFLVSIVLQGFNLGVEFAGGNEIQVFPREEFEVEEVQEVLAEFELEGASVRRVADRGDEETGGFTVRTPVLSQEQRDSLMDALQREWPNQDPERSDIFSRGPDVGEEQTRNSLIAVSLALVAMIVYITVRFRFSFAVSTIAALLHDLIIVLGVFSLFQLQVNEPFMAALLLVVGYSINDSIVIFDRIRDNMKGARKKEYPEMVNRSVFQNLTRSINTSLTTLLVLLALLIGFTFFIGNLDLILFVTALIIGVITGTYSSLFIASPLWLSLKEREFRKTGHNV